MSTLFQHGGWWKEWTQSTKNLLFWRIMMTHHRDTEKPTSETREDLADWPRKILQLLFDMAVLSCWYVQVVGYKPRIIGSSSTLPRSWWEKQKYISKPYLDALEPVAKW